MRHFATAILLILLLSPDSPAQQPPLPGATPPPAVAVKFLALFDQLRAADATRGRSAAPHLAFKLTDAEINDYMQYALKARPRPGLDSLTVKVFPSNYISTFTVIDFDAVERWHPGTIPSLLRPLLSGKKSILVDYRISARNSTFSFSVEKAWYQDVHLPAFLVEKVIGIVAARQPEKYDTSKPMPIPFGLRTIWTTNHTLEGQN